MNEVNKFFASKSFAVIGASRDTNKVGHIIFKNLLDTKQNVVGINPKAEHILNRKIYKDIFEVPYKIDCLIIATPPQTVPAILRQAGRKRIPFAVIITAGFGETENHKLEKQILEIAKEENIRLLGPNCFGYIDTSKNINTTFYTGEVQKGTVAFLSQSGAIGSAMLDKIGKFSKFVSLGNAIDLTFTDFVEYLIKDKETKVICLYIESLSVNEGRRFIDICKKSTKPIIAIKSGKTKSGQKAASTHTSSLASDSKIYTGIFNQSKIIEATSITEMFNIAKIKLKYPIIKNKGVIITNAGGYGVLTSDYCEENNIHLTKLSPKTIGKLNTVLPKNWSHNNPIDIIGDATSQRYNDTLQIIEKDPTINFVILLLTPQYMSEPEKTAKILLKFKKPIFTSFIGGKQVLEARKFLNQFKVLNYSEPENMCKIIGKVLD